MTNRGLSLIIPNHNGARVIEDSIRKYHQVFAKKFKDFEIIVVCNDCTDNSVEILNRLSKEFPLKIIEIPQRGKGHALVRGFNEAKYDLVGFMDADNPFILEKIAEMVDRINEYDVVIATKYLRGQAKIQDSVLRRAVSLGGSLFSRIVFGMRFRDTQAGAKFFRRHVWDSIDKNFISLGFDFDIEFLYKVHKAKFKILESYIPLSKYEKFSTVRLKYLPGMVARLLKLRVLK
jgi:dolichol-phosphate mannosyltransferase